jgi:hypothetical protein
LEKWGFAETKPDLIGFFPSVNKLGMVEHVCESQLSGRHRYENLSTRLVLGKKHQTPSEK